MMFRLPNGDYISDWSIRGNGLGADPVPPVVSEPEEKYVMSDPDIEHHAALFLKARGILAGLLYPYVRAVNKGAAMPDAEAEAERFLRELAKAGVIIREYDR